MLGRAVANTGARTNAGRLAARNQGLVLGLGLAFGLGGCECDEGGSLTALQGRIEVRDGRAAPDEQVAIEALDVGQVPLGVPARIPLVIANPGTDELIVCTSEVFDACGQPSLVEPEGSPFSARFENPGEQGWAVATNGERELALRFLPTAEGPVTATLSIYHDGSNGPETRIELTGEGVAPNVEISPTALDFGPVTVGRRRSLTVELANRTPFAQPISVPALEQATVVFGIIDELGNQVPTGEFFQSMVPGNGNLTLTVFFQPAAEQDYADELSVIFCPSCTETIQLSGIGIKPVFEVTPPVLDFGDVDETQSETRTFSIRNLSDRFPVTVAGAQVAGGDPQFVPTPRESLPRELAPMETLIVEVAYTGDAPGEDSGQIEVRTNAWDDPETGLDESLGVVSLTGRTMGPNIDVFPDRLAFGTIAINATPAVRPVSVVNVGTSPLTISNIQFNSTTTELELLNAPANFPVTLNPGDSTELRVQYFPRDPGLDRADLVITSDDRDEGTLTVEVTGIGGVPTTCAVAVAPSQVTFGLVERGRVVNLPVEIRNAGAQPCTLSNIALAGDMEFTFANMPAGSVNVAPGQSFRIPIAYAPTAYGNHTAQISFMSDDPSQPMVQVPVRGSSDQSEVLVIPSQVDFNIVPVRCRSPVRQVTVYNTGASTVQITRVYLDPTTTSEFELSTVNTPVTVRAGESTTIDLRYRPADIGVDTGVLFIEHSAANAPVAVPLTGEGQINPTVTDTFNQLPTPQADVLFVVDNSCSMSEEQSSLGGNLGAFLQFARNANIDFHIGVVTTDVRRSTDSGRFRGNPRIIDAMTPNGDTAFRNTVRLGTGGSASERGLEAAYLALSDPLINTYNAGFLRSNAALAVIFVSDEPDYSSRTATFYENFLRNIKGFNNTSMFSASAVVGTQQPRCSGPGGRATYAPRYINLAQNTGGVVESICAANWGQTLANIGLNSFGLRRQFTLSSQPVPSTIAVSVDGTTVPQSAGGQSNWSFDAQSNTVSFSTSRVPPEGSTITVTYSVACLP